MSETNQRSKRGSVIDTALQLLIAINFSSFVGCGLAGNVVECFVYCVIKETTE